MDEKQRLIRERAYRIWEAEGRPHGREAEHWERARHEVEADTSPSTQQSTGAAPLGAVGPAVGTPAAEPVQSRPKASAKTPAKRTAAVATRKPAANRPSKTRADRPKE